MSLLCHVSQPHTLLQRHSQYVLLALPMWARGLLGSLIPGRSLGVSYLGSAALDQSFSLSMPVRQVDHRLHSDGTGLSPALTGGTTSSVEVQSRACPGVAEGGGGDWPEETGKGTGWMRWAERGEALIPCAFPGQNM